MLHLCVMVGTWDAVRMLSRICYDHRLWVSAVVTHGFRA